MSSTVSSVSGYSADCDGITTYRFRICPWLLQKRMGTKRLQVRDPAEGAASQTFEFAWDMSHTTFPQGGGPEPKAGFFISVSVDGELFLIIGDSLEEAKRKTKIKKLPSCFDGTAAPRGIPENQVLVSRREHVVLQDSSGPYATKVRIGGQEREISIAPSTW